MPKFGAQIDTQRIPVKGLTPESGTAFPSSPTEGLLFHRTDQNKLYVYAASTWVQCDNNGVALTGHTHAQSDVTGLTTALSGKANTSHTHATSDVTGLDSALAGKAATSHTHTKSNITDLANATDTVPGLVELATTAETTTGTDATRAVTPAGLQAKINALVASAPGLLDTLDELAAALGDDPNFATTITAALAGKASTSHGHALTDAAITGTLPIAKGGTGGTTAAQARTQLSATGVYQVDVPALTAGVWSANITHNLTNSFPVVVFTDIATTEGLVLDWKVVSPSAIQVRADVAISAMTVEVTVVG